MAGKKARITRAAVAALGRGDWLTDDKLPGFRVRRPNKLALYGLSIRFEGRMRWFSIGSEVDMTPDQARGEAERLRGLKRQGVNPATDRDSRKSAPTVEKVADLFVKEHVRTKLRTRTRRHYEEIIDGLIKPRFGSLRINALSSADVSAWHASLSDRPTRANRALAILSSMIGWAIHRKLRLDNPCEGVTRYREQQINRYLTADQLGSIIVAVDQLLAEGALNPFFAGGVKVMMMTGARRSEIFEAQWSWLDIKRRCLILPDSKTGAKVITLPTAALDIILAQPRLEDCPWIFPSTKTDRPFVNFNAQWRPVLKRAGVGSWRLHDLRHGFASAAVESGAPLHVIGKQLGHSRPTTTGRYAHVGEATKCSLVESVTASLLGRTIQ